MWRGRPDEGQTSTMMRGREARRKAGGEGSGECE
jgi:hypothetical protein